ncbi:hypothetical protein D9M73_259620 [compost metagenome]
MRHVDDAHLAEDDRKSVRHQNVDGEQDKACESLHHKDRAEIANRIVAEHFNSPRRGSLAPQTNPRREGCGRGLTIHARELSYRREAYW